MGKRGPKPRATISTEWTAELAYAIGLLTADGCLSAQGSLVDLSSKDKDQIENYIRCLGLKTKIGTKSSSYGKGLYYRTQFKNVLFYQFLESVGLTPAKSKTIGKLKIPPALFFDFLRGTFDGDGCTYSYFDPRWKSSFMFYTVFSSASNVHVQWLQSEIYKRLKIKGHINQNGSKSVHNLKYAKRESLKLLRAMYSEPNVVCLSRKRLKIQKMLRTIGEPLLKTGDVPLLTN